MDVKSVIKRILGKRIEKDVGKNLEAYDKQDIVYSPFRPYQDQYTPGRNPTGINIIQEQPKKRRRE